MALVPELIYDDIVETLRGKTRNYRTDDVSSKFSFND